MPSKTPATLPILSAPRMRSTTQRPKVPAAQLAAQRAAAKDRREKMDAALKKFYSDVNTLAETAAQPFDLKGRFFLDQLIYAGQDFIRPRKDNAYNAFYSNKAKELREQGIGVPEDGIVGLHLEFGEEYEGLTKEQRQEEVKKHNKNKEDQALIRRQTTAAKRSDYSASCRILMDVMDGMKRRIGIDGFFCVVTNSVDFTAEPYWYFTDDEIAGYMKIASRSWVTSHVGYKLRAFATAGCDVTNLAGNANEKAKVLKADIVNRMNTALADATDNFDARMEYVNYDRLIVQGMGVVLEGWPLGPLVQPNRLGNSLPQLTKLRDALKDGSCKFRKIDRAEKDALYKEWQQKIADGEVVEKTRKGRSDRGVRRGPRVPIEGEEDSSSDESTPDDDEGEEEASAGIRDGSRKRKRSKKGGPSLGSKAKRARNGKGKEKENIPPTSPSESTPPSESMPVTTD
ncbi:hypothetical protein FISHEDRAFT_77476 [Fistulina hepatica ATCC 64428]|uniref:Uncharacterized protein n=1 Tax=Fistulina hepatica ATCC 64428 TaxID=1128425 RepID=A0A0D7A3T0_9AGAR|nr:hypothetical protein FISHEDRAFT_77476 [Fistulina hepatica ATCC 64428]